MLEMVAQGPLGTQQASCLLLPGRSAFLGRGIDADLRTPWDRSVSRRHAQLTATEGKVHVQQLPQARNYIKFQGREVLDFEIAVGEEFLIGTTRFKLQATKPVETAERDICEFAFEQGDLANVRYADPESRLEVLSELPQWISTALTDGEFAATLVDVVLRTIPQADAAGIVVWKSLEEPGGSSAEVGDTTDSEAMAEGSSGVSILRWSSRSSNIRFIPSQRLVRRAMMTGQSVVHVWDDSEGSSPKYTVSGDQDWAFCTPVRDDEQSNWSLYVTGQSESLDLAGLELGADLKGHVRFTEFLSGFVTAIRTLRNLERRQAHMSQFFPSIVLESLSVHDLATQLEPRECPISAMFCDVRGFSLKAEQAGSGLRELLDRVSAALSVMTRNIDFYGGVVADFQGDAAMAFWGWPTPPAEGPVSACRAALAIQREFQDAALDSTSQLADFQVGIGIGHGTGIAGQVGTQDHAKVGVFGPVVNLASRLEGMTRLFHVPIVLDQTTAEFVQRHLRANEARCRKLGVVRPKGMESATAVWQLLPPANTPGSLTDAEVAHHQEAVEDFLAGRWDAALSKLKHLAEGDQAGNILREFIERNNNAVPLEWDGVIPLTAK